MATPTSKGTATRAKTGGRVRIPIDQKIEQAAQRSRISQFDDDTTLDAELAALYLGISEKKLEELRRPTSGNSQYPRLEFIKIFDEGAVGQNQPVLYKLGVLRRFQRSFAANDTFSAAVNAGLAAWCSLKVPFFVSLRSNGMQLILSPLADMRDENRDRHFEALLRGTVGVAWLSNAKAALHEWADQQQHYRLVSAGAQVLEKEMRLLDAVLFKMPADQTDGPFVEIERT